MAAKFRTFTAIAAVGTAAVVSMTAGCAATANTTNPAGSPGQVGPAGAGTAPAGAGTAPAAIKPGLTGNAIVLADNEEFSGDDAVTDASGTAYIGWIGDNGSGGRKVSLCVLPRGATACKGGVSTIDSLDASGAYGLHVLLTGPHTVTLAWEFVTAASETGPEGDEIATATSSGGPLSAAREVATAPSFGLMLDAVAGPDGSVWTVSRVASKDTVQIRPGLSQPPVTLSTPYLIGYAQLRFAGTTPVLVIDKDGAISSPVSVASEQGGSWSPFRPVADTWTADANFGLAATPSGIRLVATAANASYQPVVASWTGSAFGPPTLTGDTSACAPSSHDPVSDASGRLADVSMECGDVAVASLPDTEHATVFRFPVHGTFGGTLPQLTTTPNGRGWVTWSIESSVSDKLMVAPLLLPGR